MSTTTQTDRAALIETALATLPSIFREAVSDEQHHKYDMMTPFLWHGFAVATDGRIAVRTSANTEMADALRAIPEKGERPDVGPIFDGLWRTEPITLDLSMLVVCSKCHGAGVLIHAEKCEFCERSGPAPCDGCEGCGYRVDGDPGTGAEDMVHAGEEIYLSPRYAALLSRHGCVVFLPGDPDIIRKLAFSGDGYSGVVMTLERGRYAKPEATS